jgi:hypothetical protein
VRVQKRVKWAPEFPPGVGAFAGRRAVTQAFFPLKKLIFPLENHCITPGGFSYERNYGKEIYSQTQC